MFEAGWALLEQIKIDTFPYCFLKYGCTCVPAVPTARAAPLPPAIRKPGHFFRCSWNPWSHHWHQGFSPAVGIFLRHDLGFLLKVPTFPAAPGWLLVWILADGNQSTGSNFCTGLNWGTHTRKPKHSCPYTQSHPVEHMELPKNPWKYKSTVLRQNSESPHCQGSVCATAMLSLVLAENLPHSISPKWLFSPEAFSS